MTLPPDVAALRLGVALAEQEHVVRLRLHGRGAYAALDGAIARGVRLRAARVAPALMLRENGSILADILAVGEAGGAVILAEGPSAGHVIEALGVYASETEIHDLSPSHALLTLEGPFAWELLGALAGPDVLAAPYMTSFRIETCSCLVIRAGKTGEYAYYVLCPREHEEELRARLAELAPQFDLRTIDRQQRAVAALEQGAFDMGHGRASELTPFELQLQWRIDYSRNAPGITALRAQRDAGAAGRVTWWIAQEGAAPSWGTPVRFGERAVGRVIHSVSSAAIGGLVGLVLLDRAVAHPGLSMSWQDDAGARHLLRTVAPPLLNNRSLFVHPHRHKFIARDELDCPPLARVSLHMER